jgi:D-arabinose 1-dehydrogenase-like Zn-dependent alcohol dehydrogenase
VIGIECVGLMKFCPGGEFPVGAKVAALMGGLGRTINGSYAEYIRAPVSNVALIESDLPWAELAAIPETYATAWTCLFRNLEITKNQTLVIRGGMSSFGQTATQMAVNAGARVIATTRSEDRVAILEKVGCFTRRAGGARSFQAHRRSQTTRRGARSCRQQHHPRFPRHAAPWRPRVLAGWLSGLAPTRSAWCS